MSDFGFPDLALPYTSAPCSHGGDVSCKEEMGDAGGFPEPKLNAGACLDLEGQPSFEEDEAGSERWPPRWRDPRRCRIADRSRPSEPRGPWLDGGLKSSTKNRERSLEKVRRLDFTSGMHDDRFTCMGGGATSVGRPLEGGCTCMEGGRGAGFTCKGVGGVLESGDFSCSLDSDSGEGALRSSVDAAQSQWVERAP